MNLNEYQNKARETAIYPAEHGLIYTSLGLVSESGEIAGKLKKIIRDHNGQIAPEDREALAHEVGDAMWYIALHAHELGYTLQEIGDMNLQKLESRQSRGVLGGSGDER